jgi:hypothetical protein
MRHLNSTTKTTHATEAAQIMQEQGGMLVSRLQILTF